MSINLAELTRVKRVVQNQTALNFHNEAALTVAKYAKKPSAIKVLEAMIVVREYKGEQLPEFTKIRTEILESIFHNLDPIESKVLKAVL